MARRLLFSGLGIALLPAAACCGPLRDPMLPPASSAAIATSASPRPAPRASAPDPAVRQLIVIDGRRFVVDGVHRLGIGDTLAGGRIERIDESTVWVRQGAALRRWPFYTGISKQPAAAEASPEPVVSQGTR